MTDPTPTRAEVERLCFHMRRQWPVGPGNMVVLDALKEAETMLSRLLACREALRERAEAADSLIVELQEQLDGSRRAHAADARLVAGLRERAEAAERRLEDEINAEWNAGLDVGWIAARDAIRALRRAAPTEGEA